MFKVTPTQNRAEQLGRTMVEMLAVFAVMILLSYLAIKFYQRGVNQRKADEIYTEIMLEAMAHYNHGTARTQKSIVDTSYRPYKAGEFAVEKNCPDKSFFVKVNNVDEGVCRLLMQKEWHRPIPALMFYRMNNWGNLCSNSDNVNANGYYMTSPADCSLGRVEKGVFAVAFAPKGDAKEIQYCQDDDACYPNCQECDLDQQICVDVGCGEKKECTPSGQCDWNFSCGEEQYVNALGDCDSCPNHAHCDRKHFVCDDGYYLDDGECVACAPHVATCTGADTPTSCESGWGLFSGQCKFQCSTANDCIYHTQGNTCTNEGYCTCGANQTLTPTGCYVQNKVLEDAYCAGGIKEENGEKLCCWKSGGQNCCPYGQIWIGGVCKSCDDPAAFNQTDMNYCLACPDRVRSYWRCFPECQEEDQEVVAGQCRCPLERPIMLDNGICHSCQDGWQTLNGSNVPVGYTREQIARLCNYEGGTSGYSYPCSAGRVGLWAGETYTQNGETIKAPGYGACAPCDSVTVSQMNSRARCEACNGTWESSQPGTQDEWLYGSCTLKCAQEHSDCVVWDEESGTCQNKCTPVEWIEATGTQYINTGIAYKSSMSIKGKYSRMAVPIYSITFLATTTVNPIFRFPMSYGKGDTFSWARSGYTQRGYTQKFSDYPYTAEVELDAQNDILKINGTTVMTEMIKNMGGKDQEGNATPYTSYSVMYLFSAGNTGYGKGKVYYLKIWDGNTLVRDFVPVISPEGKGCLFDNVEKVLYCAKGSGDFLYGPVVN